MLAEMLIRQLWVPKNRLAAIKKDPFNASMSPENIQSGFPKCGIFPFDPNAIDKSTLKDCATDEDLSIPHPSDEDTSAMEKDITKDLIQI